mmetsp:Transcript_68901/g.192500  ORF Transcript_68901/g.192500 Transcript_68901/m.192500 type:complete len:140 (+) Transcript_68901:444-863(+)
MSGHGVGNGYDDMSRNRHPVAHAAPIDSYHSVYEKQPLMNPEYHRAGLLSVSEISKNRKGVGWKSYKNCDFSPFAMAVTLLTVYFCVAILIGMVLEDWDFTDTIYFSISTLTTVGYGDVVSHSTRTSRLVTAIFVFIGE